MMRPDVQNMKRLLQNYPLVLVVLTLLIFSAALSWSAYQREAEFLRHQQEIAEQSVAGAAIEVTLLVKQLQRMMSLLAEEHEEMLWQLSIDPENETIFQHLHQHIADYLPDYHWFTVADGKGDLLHNDFGEKVGELCQADIRQFIDTEHRYGTYIHPGPDKYHFDIMAPWSYKGEVKGVFFVSFEPQVIARLLQNSQVAGHQLILLRNDLPDLIEITSQGGRDKLDRPIHLSEEELSRIGFSKQTEGTRWTLVDLPPAGFHDRLHAQIYGQVILVLAGFIVISMVLLRLIRNEEKKRANAETALRNSRDLLESRVAERTRELEHTNDNLRREIKERVKAQDKLQYLAHHDTLTGLPNRVLLCDRLEHAFAQSNRTGKLVAILFLDLDRFKVVNDSLGHHSGDELLITVANRLKNCIREGDTVSRLAGDEFAVILEGIDDIGSASHVAEHILEAVEEPITISGTEVTVTTSIGLTIYPIDCDDIDACMRNADIAMYRAKNSTNAYTFFTTEMTAHALERLEMQNQLRKALQLDEFVLFYQPRIDLQTGAVCGFEALLRWQHPELGLVSPDRFIQLLEESGLIVQVGEWVLRTACEFNQQRIEAGYEPLRVSVNLSPRQFNDKDLVRKIDKCLENTGMDARYLELEITETLLVEKIDEAVDVLASLNAKGIHISIDDFGTGYSSMSYLKKFPIDTLKIDRCFIKDVIDDADDAAIVTAIIAMAHSLRICVTAEGVEDRSQLSFLKKKGCEEAQGYLISKPLPDDVFETWLNVEMNKEKVS